jgi:hypothetical protein
MSSLMVPNEPETPPAKKERPWKEILGFGSGVLLVVRAILDFFRHH